MDIQVDKEWEDREVKKLKLFLINKSKQPNVKKKDIVDQYRDSKLAYRKFIERKKKQQWKDAFYTLHLYLRIVLEQRLHIAKGQSTSEVRVAQEALQNLKGLEREMGICMQGIRIEVRNAYLRSVAQARLDADRKRRQEEEDKRKAIEEEAKRRLELEERQMAQLPPPAYTPPPEAAYPVKQATIGGGLTEEQKKLLSNDHFKGLGQPIVTPTEETTITPPFSLLDEQSTDLSRPEFTREMSTVSGTVSIGQTVDSTNMLDAKHKEKEIQYFRVKRIPGDGHCAFRAIVQGFAGGTLGSQQETRDAMNLRKLAAKKLVQLRDEEMTGTGLTVEQIILMDNDSSYSTFGEYINAIGSSKYGGGTEFWVLAKTLNASIAIYVPEGDGYKEIVTYGEGKADPVRILWQKGMSEGGNHYDLLLPL